MTALGRLPVVVLLAVVPAMARAEDLPGLVGMHNHFFDTAWRNVDDDGRLLPPGFPRSRRT